MMSQSDAHLVAAEVARGLHQLWLLGLLSEGGRGDRPADQLEVVQDALAQTESGALAGYGASDTRFALDVWRLVGRLLEGGQSVLGEMTNHEVAAFLAKLRSAAYGPQVSSALARWLPSRMFISAQYAAQQLEKLRPGGNFSGWPTGKF